MKRFRKSLVAPEATSSWNVTGRVLVSAAFRILLTRAWNLSALQALIFLLPIIRKQGANLGVQQTWRICRAGTGDCRKCGTTRNHTVAVRYRPVTQTATLRSEERICLNSHVLGFR